MRRVIIWVFALSVVILIARGPAYAGPIASSVIDSVTLFSNQALITRSASTSVKKGLNEIELEIDSFHIDPDSVTARVFGEGEIYSVQYKEVPVKESSQDKIREIIENIEQLQNEKQGFNNRKKSLLKNEAFLDSFIDFSKTQISKELKTDLPDTENLNQTIAFLSTNYQKIYAEIQSIDVEVAEIDKELGVLKRELQMLRSSSRNVQKVIAVLFNTGKTQNIKLQAQYIVRNAGWQPLYKASLPSLSESVDLTMFARIVQQTGEDWKNVSLSISNVIPLKGIRLPSLQSWLLDLPRPRSSISRSAGRTAPRAKAAPDMEMLAEAPAEDIASEEAEFVQAQKRRLPLSFEYKVKQRIKVESRKKETILPLFSKQLTGDFYHWSVPKNNRLTFLAANVKADKELLDGPLNVYFGGQYIGKTYLEGKKAGEVFNLSLGADREVIVKYEKIKDQILETYFGKFDRSNIARELEYKITAENLKDQTVVLKILDSIPVSKTDRIQVKNLDMEPSPTQRNYLDRKGVMLWELTLKPGAKAEISIAFDLGYPKNVTPPIY